MRRMQLFGHRTIFEKLPQSRRLCSCGTDCINDLIFVELQKTSCCRSRAKSSACSSGVPQGVMRPSNRFACPNPDFISSNDGFNELLPVGVDRLADGDSR